MFNTSQILFILIFFFSFTHSQYSEMVNVGTILFSDVDNSRTCWSNEQLALLRARMIYQDILPQDNVINMKDDRFITDLVTYFKMAVEKVKKMATGKTKQLNLMALTDTIGGYLRHIILPMARHGFYSGNLNYASTGKLYDLYSELKSYLRTDGSTWAAPKKGSFFKQKRQIEALPEAVEGSVNGDPCSGLIFSEGTDSGIVIPMPFFDLQSEPSAIAVPFKTNPLRNIISKNSAFVLVKFYMAATKCLQSKNADKKSTDRFTFEFNHFLDQQVLPRLEDERLYPAFGSVYRIKESLDKGFAIPTKGENAPSNETNTEESEICLDKSSTVIFSAIGGTAVLWAVITTLYCLLRKKSNDPASARPSTRSVGGMSLSNKGGSFGAPSKTTCPAKVNLPQSDSCIKCKKSSCTDPKSAKDSKTTNFVTSVTSYFRKNSSRTIKSVSISGSNSKSHSSMVVQRMFPTSKTSSSSTTTTTTTNADKPMVFGYDFETSTSESDSDESIESSHPV